MGNDPVEGRPAVGLIKIKDGEAQIPDDHDHEQNDVIIQFPGQAAERGGEEVLPDIKGPDTGRHGQADIHGPMEPCKKRHPS